MRPLEKVPAVRRIETDRDDVFAVEIMGEFTSADAENLCGLLEGAFALKEDIDLVAVLSGLESVDLTDLSSETASFMRAEVARHVTRCAVVGDGMWSDRVSRLFEPRSGAEFRHFLPDDEAHAWQWIGTRPLDQ